MERPQLFGDFARLVITLAATALVLFAARLASSILNPILFALVLSLIFSPVYGWLRRRLPSWLALIIMMVGLSFFFGGLFYIMGASITNLAARLTTYVGNFEQRLDQIEAFLQSQGITTLNYGKVLSNSGVINFFQSILGGITGLLSGFFFILMTMLFFLAEGPDIMKRLRQSLGESPQIQRLTVFGESVIRQFGLRAVVNAVTGAGVTVILLILGVDFAVLWGILVFFLSYIPYIGTIIAAIPPVLLAFAEFGLGKALIVIAGFTIANIIAENVLSPALMSRGLSISPTVVFLSFALWTWLLGAPGAFFAMPITFFLLLVFESFPETQWLARVMMITPLEDEGNEIQERSPAP